MIVQRNDANGPRVARCPWNPGIIGGHRLTISNQDWDNVHEVAMSFGANDGGPHKFYWEDDCSDIRGSSAVLWTQAASGGCWPFGVIVRNRGNAGPAARSIGLAHLAYKRDEEAALMGHLFAQLIGPPAGDVYLVVMLEAAHVSVQETNNIEQSAFKAFEAGFGATLANSHKILVVTTTVNAGVSRHGHFGELSNEDVSALTRPWESAAHTKGRPCNVIVEIPRAEVRPRAYTL
jgi:hypothetical protein